MIVGSAGKETPEVTETGLTPPTWLTPQGEPVACVEKIKILNENLAEIKVLAEEALADAVLMGCDEAQFRDVLRDMADRLVNPYRKRVS